MPFVSARLLVAAYQMQVSADIEANFSRIKSGIERAARGGAKMLALPECALCGYPPLYRSSAAEIDMPRISKLNEEICNIARANNIWVVLGTITRGRKSLLNSALVISSKGKIAADYHKMHLMPEDKAFFRQGTCAQAFKMGGITAGVLICYDARFPEPYRHLREQGAQLIVTISCVRGKDTWKIPVLEGTYRTRASENSCFLVAVNTGGPMQAAESMIINPLGIDMVRAELDHDEMMFAEIDLSETDYGYYYDRRSDKFEVRAKSRATGTTQSAPQ